MNRLTKKRENSILIYYYLNLNITENGKIQKANYYDAINKLGQIEDYEEKLGIDFITLYKAFENGVRILDDGKPYTDWVDLIYSKGIPYGFKGRVSDHCVYFKDFGKTWTLATKEKSS